MKVSLSVSIQKDPFWIAILCCIRKTTKSWMILLYKEICIQYCFFYISDEKLFKFIRSVNSGFSKVSLLNSEKENCSNYEGRALRNYSIKLKCCLKSPIYTPITHNYFGYNFVKRNKDLLRLFWRILIPFIKTLTKHFIMVDGSNYPTKTFY